MRYRDFPPVAAARLLLGHGSLDRMSLKRLYAAS